LFAIARKKDPVDESVYKDCSVHREVRLQRM
jgi:hypothetical protein